MHLLRALWDVAPFFLRRALVFIGLALMLQTFALPARAQVPWDSAAERTGSEPPADLAAPGGDHRAPDDAPRLGPGRLSPTPAPPGFNTFDGGWIRFYYHPSIREHVQRLISESTVIRQELSERLGAPVLARVRVDVARTPGEMATLAPRGAPYPEYAAGVAYSEIALVLLSVGPVHPTDASDLVQVFRHELAHVALFDAVAGAPIPRWFNEGFAVLASGESSMARLQSLWVATLADSLLPLASLDKGFPRDESTAETAYAQSVDVVRYLVRQREQYRFRGLIERMRSGEEFPSALLGAYGLTLIELEQEWREDVAKRYTFWPVLFGGTFVWMGTFGLFVMGWRRRKRKARATLARWAEEEAREEQQRQQVQQQARRVHIVLARSPQPTSSPLPQMPPPEAEVPKVQHEGQWHTLH
ncbi:MAG TPA: peptidase MA family metallohydrolase [Polyangiaceae bacterium]|nr:peptidase MA family metallohydrolase [Polyangiaceae bacterium]